MKTIGLCVSENAEIKGANLRELAVDLIGLFDALIPLIKVSSDIALKQAAKDRIGRININNVSRIKNEFFKKKVNPNEQ